MIACLLLATPVELSLLPRLTDFTPLVEAAGATFFLNLGRLDQLATTSLGPACGQEWSAHVVRAVCDDQAHPAS